MKMRVLLAVLALGASVGCAQLRASQGPAPAAKKPRPVVTAENRVVLMPYGKYHGTKDQWRDATLWLNQDQTFTLSWQDKRTSVQGQWDGTFEWLKKNGFDTIGFYDVKEAVNARRGGPTRDVEQALTRIDAEKHAFAIDVPTFGTVDFKPVQ